MRFLWRLWWRLQFLAGRPRSFYGTRISVLLPALNTRDAIVTSVALALFALKKYSPRDYARLHAYVAGILVQGDDGTDRSQMPLAEWHRDTRYILLAEHHAASEDVRLAATLVHEATHAWLEAAEFQYTPQQRTRIEAICFRAEAAFYRRLPGSEELALYAEECAAHVRGQSLAEWSDTAFRVRDLARLRALGTPGWVVKVLERLSARRAA